MKTNAHFLLYLSSFFSEWETIQTKIVEKIKTHILRSIRFFSNIARLWDNLEKHCRAGQTRDDNTVLAGYPSL